jgi:EAL domain-containing protein (putative c-di-GMP-specific phosphodiesterase class I)/FixJ family two-component response regulator
MESWTPPARLLGVDDEPAIGELIETVARELGVEARIARNGADFRSAFRKNRPSVVILDLMMPGDDGVKLLHYLAQQNFSGRVIISSGMDRKTIGSAARLAAAYGFATVDTLPKPLNVARLENLLKTETRNPSVKEAPPVDIEQIRAAIRNSHFVLLFQPKVSLKEEYPFVMDSAEALARLRLPGGGLASPDEFIPVAEADGTIDELAKQVLDAALGQARLWKKAGNPLPVAVNVPASLAMSLDLPEFVEMQLNRHEVDSSLLILEITETGVISDIDKAMEALTRLRLMGVALSIDDFGTGFSSILQLHHLPFTELKVDKSLVLELDDNTDARLIVRSIIELGHKLGLSVCAEGVETRKTVAMLRSWGCDKAQGFLFALPSPAEDLTHQFAEKSTLSTAESSVFTENRRHKCQLVGR